MASVKSSARPRWRIPIALILLSVIPVIGGAVLLIQLAHGARITPANARFFAEPFPVVVHIIAASLFLVLGPFQFVPALRRRRPGLHRAAGRLLVLCGIGAGLAGLWMAWYYPLAPADVELLRGVRTVFGSALVVSVVLGFIAIRRRDIARHRAWMIRGYAIGQGAGTQALISLPWVLATGKSAEGLSKVLWLTAGWLINIAIAELIIRNRLTIKRRPWARRTADLTAPAGTMG